MTSPLSPIIMHSMAYHQLTIRSSPDNSDALVAFLMTKGCLGVIDKNSELIAYFYDTFDIKSLVRELELVKTVLFMYGSGQELQMSSELIQDQDWNETWKKGFKPLDIGTLFTILPPWEEPQGNRINLIIDPGMAFGTGHHETTRSCLILMEKYQGLTVKERFLDLGTGTGLLAIAASKLGYKQVVAIDTDPLATEAARSNIALNKATNVEIREGSMDTATEKYDCITANIISGVLIMLAPSIARHLAYSGIVILSGILAEQADEVITGMRNSGFVLVETYRDDKWISLVMRMHHKESK